MLEVDTDLDVIVDELFGAIEANDTGTGVARWHFFIGSPGNGKSATVGKLCRKLISQDYRLVTEEEVEIEDLPTGSGQVPYLVKVYKKGMPYEIAWFAQDASVVKNPFSEDMDPAKELINLLQEAWDRGVSLIVCTNRGVIERAFRRLYLDQSKNTLTWFKTIKFALTHEGIHTDLTFNPETKKKPFEKFSFKFTELDNKSLLIGDTTVFRKLIDKAISHEDWTSCENCEVRQVCPFKLNKEWLADSNGLEVALDVLKKAELLSGQIIVFREALAILSYLLAGCPRDYNDQSPCAWVKRRVDEGDFFSLLSRRIYMAFYSSYTAYGLEYEQEIKGKQLAHLRQISTEDNKAKPEIIALNHVVNSTKPLSTDVGATRLFGPDGIFRKLDPVNDGLSSIFSEAWDEDLIQVESHPSPLVSDLERSCCKIWQNIEQQLEASPENTLEKLKWFRRWVSAYTLRLGGMIEKATSFKHQLDELLGILEITSMGKIHDVADIDELDENIEHLLRPEGNSGIDVTEFVSLDGSWVNSNVKPRIAEGADAKNLSLILDLGQGEQSSVNAEIYIWLKRKIDFNMAISSFPMELLESAKDTLVRAAARSDYAYQDDGIELKIRQPDGAIITLKRTRRGVTSR